MASIEALVETALEAAEAAARVHAESVGSIAVADAVEKGPSDFVSHVDLEAQKAVVDVVLTRFPGHRILSEEEADPDSPNIVILADLEDAAPPDDSAPPLWIVDPLDGTTNFLHGHPLYAASVGVTMGGRPVAGAVVSSATDERWVAGRGTGAFRNGRPIRVSDVDRMSESLAGTGFPFKRMAELPRFLGQVERVLPATSGIRRGGSAALDLCYLAQGSLDVFWECRLDPWDIAAGMIILEEAGGVAARIGGSRLDVWRPGSVIAANSSRMLEELDALLADPTT